MIDLPPPPVNDSLTPVDPAVLAEAAAAAERAADAVGVDIRLLHSTEETVAAAELLSVLWGRQGALPMTPEMIKVLAHTGNHVTGAFDRAGTMVGCCVAFHSMADFRDLHSHIAGVLPHLVGRAVGFALKQHQRAWALARGVRVVEWTFDPLVARNANFNFTKLGAEATAYLVDYYGEMDDAINGGQPTDRVLIRWRLDSGRAAAAAAGQRQTVAADTPGVTWVPIPPDIEAMRQTDPDTARQWRLRLRDQLAPALDSGSQLVGFDRTLGYALSS
jgi:predicted GNAT superfamily acetyltransferase